MTNVAVSHLYAICVCEDSGDILAEGLVKRILEKDPSARFTGVYGPRIRAVIGKRGQILDMSRFAVMGVAEVLKVLPRILMDRRKLKKALLAQKPDVFIGIDAPDFNLNVECFLKQHGILTVHYVSPSVWAWREKRVFKVKEAADLVLSILPFEKAFYDRYGVACTYVGHRLAREIRGDVAVRATRVGLGFSEGAYDCNQIIGIFPGSRHSEIKFLTPEFAQTAYNLKRKYPAMRFVCATPTFEKAQMIAHLWNKNAPNIPLTVWVGRSREVMASCNAIMVASGTAALEAMFLRKRMVVCYIVNEITAAIGRRMLQIDSYSLPNILSGKKIVPELIQEDCNPANIENEIFKILNTENREQLIEFARIHRLMNIDSDSLAAEAVLELVRKRAQATQAKATSVPNSSSN